MDEQYTNGFDGAGAEDFSIPWDEIPDSLTVADGYYTLEGKKLTLGESRSGLKMFTAYFQVVEPADFAGIPLTVWFAVGTKEDPQARDPKTWGRSPGGRDFKKWREAANLSPSLTASQLINAFNGSRIVAFVQKEKMKDGARAGEDSNRVKSYFPLGHNPAQAGGTPIISLSPAQVGGSSMTCPRCAEAVPVSAWKGHVSSHQEAA